MNKSASSRHSRPLAYYNLLNWTAQEPLPPGGNLFDNGQIIPLAKSLDMGVIGIRSHAAGALTEQVDWSVRYSLRPRGGGRACSPGTPLLRRDCVRAAVAFPSGSPHCAAVAYPRAGYEDERVLRLDELGYSEYWADLDAAPYP